PLCYNCIWIDRYEAGNGETMNDQRESRIQVLVNWVLTRPAEIAMIFSLCIGYLAGVLAAQQLNLLNFLAFTVVNLLYGGIALLIMRAEEQSTRRVLWAIVLVLLTVASGLLALSGLWFNWLLYFVTVSICFTYLPLSRAFIFFLVLFMLEIGNSYLL